MKTVIFWFRRDLRISDNTALNAAAATGAAVIPVYVRSAWTGFHRWTGANRQEFLCGCLASLDGNLRRIGGRLIVREGRAEDALLTLARESGATAIFANRDPDPFGRSVEEELQRKAGELGIQVDLFKDAAIHEQEEVLTANGEPYRVFTPYSRAWLKQPKPAPGPRLKALRVPDGVSSLPLPQLSDWKLSGAGDIVEPGERAARARLDAFLNAGVGSYDQTRNTPAGLTTSRLSQDLRWGLLSIREVLERCESIEKTLPPSGRASVRVFINELIWREFYMQILWRFPDVLDVEFNAKYRGMPWPGTDESFARWCNAETGFPIIDAAMRQLRLTGFMHNRARMITAMFLTKDLHVDWRKGEQWFMQTLTDGEIASNNGGWQWSAGTGADAAPYFRIQNPWTQSARFDPEGRYIREWLPELRGVAASRLHAPPDHGTSLVAGYPAPMVDHSQERERTLDRFKQHLARAL